MSWGAPHLAVLHLRDNVRVALRVAGHADAEEVPILLHTVRGDQGQLMLRYRVVPQSR